jgi:predicted Zn-dependent peptidase
MRFLPKVHELGKLRVVLVPEDRESVTVRVMIGTGSREEDDREAGSAHFLEHFVFKGTQKFPGMFDINEAVERVGGAFNAYTGQNEMGFWVKMDKKHASLAAQIVGQVVTKPILPQAHFDKERGTILEELYMYEDRPSSKAAEECTKLLFGQTSMGRSIIGTVKSLQEMTVESLRAYWDKWFVAENMIVGVVGDYGSEKEILEILNKEFAFLVNDERKSPVKNKFEWSDQDQPKVNLTSRKAEQAAVVMAFRGITESDERRHALELLNIILGNGWMSRLIREVREERGWAYAIGSDFDLFTDTGAVFVGAGLPKNKLNEAIELIVEIATGLWGGSKWAVKKEEVKVAKDTFRGRFSLAFDKPEKVLGSALWDLMFRGKIYTPEEILTSIEKVSLDEVRDLAKEIFQKKYLSIAVVGDYKRLDFKI